MDESTVAAWLAGSVEGEFSNVFFLAFDVEGRCREFSEIYMKRPAR